MGIFSKLMFWKKEEEPSDMGGMDDFGGMGMPGEMPGMPGKETPGMPKQPGGMPGGETPGMPDFGAQPEAPSSPAFQTPRLEEVPPGSSPPSYGPTPQPAQVKTEGAYSGKDLEIISLKLDSLKTTLEAINERLARLEKMAEGGSESSRF